MVVLAFGVASLVSRTRGGGPEPGQPVERLTHVHGLAIPQWASDEVYVATHEGPIRVDGAGGWRHVSTEPLDFMGFSAHPTEQADSGVPVDET